MKLLIGPIIGKVTDTTARILLEFDSDISATVTLISPKNQEKQLTLQLQGRRPTIFKFDGLEPFTKYTVKISPYEGELKSSFRTFRTDNDEKNLKIAWVSCNDAQKNDGYKERNLWYYFEQEVLNGTYDMACHIGDQVYLDSDLDKGNTNNVYCHTKELVFNKYSKQEWSQHEEEIKEIIREEYRRAWTFPPTASVLANIPNVMIYDDHDIRDDWGFLQDDWNPNSDKCDYFYGRMCQIVYYEYQRQLWDDNLDLNDISKVKEEYFTLKIGKIGFFFMDIRGDRTWHRTEEFGDKKMLSTKQWERFDKALSQDFQDVENIILISQSTVIFLNKAITKIISTKVNDSLEQWVLHSEEQVKLLKKLYDWKFNSHNKNREVTIVCGDIHFGGHIDIFYQGKPAFKQFTSSSITNGVKQKHIRLATTIALAVSEEIRDGFSFYHRGFTGKNNYGYSHIYNKQISSGNVQSKVDSCNIVANDPEQFLKKKFVNLEVIDNITFYQDKKKTSADCSCCKIF